MGIFELEFLGIPRNSESALCKLGIPSPNYRENSHLGFLGIPRNFFLGILRKFLGIPRNS